jgi:hypothetical protein
MQENVAFMISPATIITVLVCITLLSIWLGIITYLLIKQNTFFRTFTSGVAKNDLKTMLKNIAGSMKRIGEELTHQELEIKQIQISNQNHLQKIGFLRYNPFSDTGGDQSFCLCLLDAHNDGFVITSLHSREQTRIYAKAITKGVTKGYELSKEEIQAVDLAIKRK